MSPRQTFMWPWPLSRWPWKPNQIFVSPTTLTICVGFGSNSFNSSRSIEFTWFPWVSLRDLDLWPHELENVIGVMRTLVSNCDDFRNSKKYVLQNVYLPTAVAPCTVIEIFDCNCNDLELGRFYVIQGQRSLSQSKAHGWYPIWPSLSPTSYLSPFARHLTFTPFFHRSNGQD